MQAAPAPQTKGSNLIPSVKFLRSRKERARARLPADLHGYLESRILPSSWYPQADLTRMMRVILELVPGEPRAVWESFGEVAAEAHCAGAYKGFFDRGPRRLLESYDALWKLQNDSGRWRIELGAGNVADARLFDFPAGMPEYGNLMVGYFRRVLALSGAAEPGCTLLDCDAASGHWRLSWRG